MDDYDDYSSGLKKIEIKPTGVGLKRD